MGLCTIAGLATAQETPGWEVSGGYQYTRFDLGSYPAQSKLSTDTLNIPAFDAKSHVNSSGFNLGVQENLNNWFGGIFLFSGAYPNLNTDVTPQEIALGAPPPPNNGKYIAKQTGQMYTFLFGPQLTLRRSGNVQPFVRGLIGGAHAGFNTNILENGAKLLASDIATPDTSVAFGGGAGVDIRLSPRLYFRGSGDVIRTNFFNDSQAHVSVSAGLSYRVGSR
jgi:hypothetical protein